MTKKNNSKKQKLLLQQKRESRFRRNVNLAIRHIFKVQEDLEVCAADLDKHIFKIEQATKRRSK
ncbi:MAG: hypothetical protein JNJ47_03200 [Alphaproteobacteria bacterium]|nr:hypothetical protein [Alphaproteobacteria bacterium]